MSSQNTNTQNPSPFRDGVSPQHAYNSSPFRDGVSSPFRDGVDKLNTARLLYMAGDTTQKSIAKQVNVSERTIHSWIKENHWDKLRQAARSAPAVIAENMFSQLVELQNDIASREVGKRYPTMQEAELTRKLCLSIDRMKSAPGLSQSMQVLQLFRTFAKDRYDSHFQFQLNRVIEHFLEGNAKNGFMPYQMEYGEITLEENYPPPTDSISGDKMEESFPPATSVPTNVGKEPVRGGGGQIDEKRSLFVNQGGDDSAHETPTTPPNTSDIKTEPAKTGSKTEANPHQNPVNTSIPPSANPTGNSSNFPGSNLPLNYLKAL